MIEIVCQGDQVRMIETIVMDFNGTLAKDGELLPGISEKLTVLSRHAHLVVLTGDVYGTVENQMAGTGVETIKFTTGDAGQGKLDYVRANKPLLTAAIGNGLNDMLMMEASGLSVAVLGDEGCHGRLLCLADIVVSDIHKALDLFLHPSRIKATLNR